jgi:myosin heavy subunit
MSAETAKKMDTGRIITILLIVVLGAGMAFFAVKYFGEKSLNEEKELNIENLTAEIEDLETDIEDFKTDLENKDLDIQEKERLLEEKEVQLQEKQRKIDQLLKQNKISSSEAAELRGKVEQLDFYIKRYQKEIEELKQQVVILTKNNDSLKVRTDSLGTVVRRTKDKLDETTGQLNAAKILSARPFTFYRKKSSGKAIEESEFRRGQMEDFKVCFDIAQNLAADRGRRTAYVQMIDPSGVVVKDNQGGSFKNYAGESITYSATAGFEFDKVATNICMDFPTPSGYEYGKGNHVVRVWCDGYDIGEASFNVK